MPRATGEVQKDALSKAENAADALFQHPLKVLYPEHSWARRAGGMWIDDDG